ncbi:MAG: radical SAM protein [Planctomycetes bacterium]|nr:radical SAM protein [Planctomycetota bacterium]
MSLKVLYRGSLVSCNYGCDYCPFAKRRETRAEMEQDRREVERFVEWVGGLGREIELLFTPWGEGLVRPWYQEALVELSLMSHVKRVAIQTNLSMGLGWVEGACRETLALWATFHPGEVARERFVAKCEELDRRGVRHSVGIVGLREHLADMDSLRSELGPSTYLWVNAYKRETDYYSEAELERIRAVDPLFDVNNTYHESLGRPCRTGQDAFAVDGAGTLRRCHFLPEPLGNVYEQRLDELLAPRPCAAERCGCYIGYVHLEPLGLYETYGAGVMERIPASPIWRRLPVTQAR